MRNDGLEVYTVVAGGASPYYWLKSYESIPSSIGYWEKFPNSEKRLQYIRAVPKLESLMEKHHPDVVVVQTGINLYATLRSKRHSKKEDREKVASLIDQMCFAIARAGARSYWILPPRSHVRKYPEALQEELRQIMTDRVRHFDGEIFESQNCTKFTDPYPATDGIHYGAEDSIRWAKKVALHFANYMKVTPSGRPPKIAKGLPLQTDTSSLSGTTIPHLRAIPVSLPDRPGASTSANGKSEPVDLILKLVKKSELRNPNQAPYENALGMFEYKVIKDKKGNYQFDRIRVVHGIMFHNRPTSSARRKLGDEIELLLVPFSKYPGLRNWYMQDDLRQNLALPIYTPELN